MKKSFKALASSLRSFWWDHDEDLKLALLLLCMISTAIIAYHITGMYQRQDTFTTQKYNAYSDIIMQIASGDLTDVRLPENTKISSVTPQSITVSNTLSYYSVKGKLSNNSSEIEYVGNDGSFDRFGVRFGFGILGFLAGFIVFFALYGTCKFSFFIGTEIHDGILEIKSSYKENLKQIAASEEEKPKRLDIEN